MLHLLKQIRNVTFTTNKPFNVEKNLRTCTDFACIKFYQCYPFNFNNQVIRCGRLPGGFAFKEVIQPQVPLGLPCYDFTPVMNHSVVTVLP
jgi:hypothetical protein